MCNQVELYKMFAGLCLLLATAQCLQIADGANLKSTSSDLPIKNPGPGQETDTRYGDSAAPQQTSSEFKDKSFCSVKPPDYPQKKFGSLFKDMATVQSLQILDGANVRSTSSDLPIKNPEPVQETETRYGDSSTPQQTSSECKDKSFCSVKPPDYPQKKFSSLFKDMTPFESPALVIEDSGNGQGGSENRDDCESIVTYEPLYRVLSTKRDWRIVMQAPEQNYIQRIRLETCKNPGGKCFNVFPSVPNFTTSCKQKYDTLEMLVEGLNGGAPEKIKAELPVSCSCTYESTSSEIKTQ